MMQLVCNGVALDLYDNAGLQFTHKNPLFAFDDLECERTTQFKLPSTPTNDRAFSLARIPAYAGTGMRRRFSTQLQAGTVVKNGYLYVASFDGKDYAAIFVTGELVGLQAIRDAGSIKDWYAPADTIVWSAANVQDANTVAGQATLAITRYKSDNAPCHPSFDLGDLMQLAYNDLTGKNIGTYTRGFRLIPKSVEPLPKMSVAIAYAGTGVNYDESYEPAQYANTMSISAASNIITQQDLVLTIGVGGTQTQWKYLKLHQFITKQTIIITFPSDFPNGYYLMSIEDKGTDGSDPENNPLSNDWFLGGYSFKQKPGGGIDSTGTPLAGRSVEIPSGTPFMILSSDAYEYQPAPFNWDGFRHINETSYTYNFTGIVIEGKEAAVGDTIRAIDLLPDLTLVELFKIYSYCTGLLLMYDEANGVTFDALNLNTWQVLDITHKLTKCSEVKRTFGSYAQHNYLLFESGSDVPISQRVITEYTIDNDNIEYEKNIAEIPYSEGSIDVDEGYIVARFDAEDAAKHTLYADAIMVAENSKYGERISLPKNEGLQQLCDMSTQFKVSARMSLYEYEQVTPKTILQVYGSQYVWTERSWQKNEAQFTLAKIA